jgi:hypothetical protein
MAQQQFNKRGRGKDYGADLAGGINNALGASLTLSSTNIAGNHANADGGGLLNFGIARVASGLIDANLRSESFSRVFATDKKVSHLNLEELCHSHPNDWNVSCGCTARRP